MKPFGLSCFHHRPGIASSALISSPRALVSDPYRFGRFWKDKDYALEGLEENARRIDPTHWKRRSVLFFWTVRVFVLLIAGLLEFILEQTDLLFYDPATELGCAFFGGQVRLLPMRQASKVGHDSWGSSMRPSRGEGFLQNPLRIFGTYLQGSFPKGANNRIRIEESGERGVRQRDSLVNPGQEDQILFCQGI